MYTTETSKANGWYSFEEYQRIYSVVKPAAATGWVEGILYELCPAKCPALSEKHRHFLAVEIASEYNLAKLARACSPFLVRQYKNSFNTAVRKGNIKIVRVLHKWKHPIEYDDIDRAISSRQWRVVLLFARWALCRDFDPSIVYLGIGIAERWGSQSALKILRGALRRWWSF